MNTTLQDWRLTWKEGGARKGPAFVRLGHRTVRYRESAVAAYLAGLGAGQDG